MLPDLGPRTGITGLARFLLTGFPDGGPMISAVLALLVAQTTPQDTLPQDTDNLVSIGGESKLVLVLDESCSMNSDNLNFTCPIVPYEVDSRQDQLKAALGGCSGNDGVFDLFAADVEFAIYGFGGGLGVRQIQDYTNDVVALRNAVRGPQNSEDCNGATPGVKACGTTPMTEGMRVAADHMKTTFDVPFAGTGDDDRICNKFHMVVLGDGFPNAGGAQNFTGRCDGTVANNVPQNDPSPGAAYIGNGDMMCAIDGEQQINTWTIGFGSGYNPGQLQAMAQGDGAFFEAADVVELTEAFNDILLEIVQKEAVAFGASSVNNDGLFSGNFSYLSSFKPASEGPWPGNLKKACVFPDFVNGRYSVFQNTCLFRAVDGGRTLVVNENPFDQFVNGEPLFDATRGGMARKIFTDDLKALPNEVLGGSLSAKTDVYDARPLYTWKPGTVDFLTVDDTNLSEADVVASGCLRYRLFSFLYGYEFTDDFDCAGGIPTITADWSMGAVVNGGTALMQYGTDCTTSTCHVAVGTNSGVLHFADALSGAEAAAFVPGDLWKSGNVTDRSLVQMLDQPTVDYRRMPGIDGGMSLFHDDLNGDSIIDASEDALLTFGLGHGGAAYYLMDVSLPVVDTTVPTPNSARSPVFSVARTPGNWTEHLRSTFASMVAGVGRFPGRADDRRFLAITSGMDWDAARPDHDYASFDGTFVKPPGGETLKTCNDILGGGASQAFCLEAGDSVADRKNDLAVLALGLNTFAGTSTSAPQIPASYETVANPSILDDTFPLALGTNPGPFDAAYTLVFALDPKALNVKGVTFDLLELEDGDSIDVVDRQGNVIRSITSADNGANKRIDFFIAEKTVGGDPIFGFILKMDGIVKTPGAVGALIQGFWVEEEPQRNPDHKPFLAVLDVKELQAADRAFESVYKTGPELLLVTEDCAGSGVPGGTCIDKSTSPDLEDLLCPISAQPSTFTEGGTVRAFYFGDMCGQIWKVYRRDGSDKWEALKLAVLNERFDPSTVLAGSVESQNLRRIERPLDIFVTGCAGGKQIGIGFGSGNLSRPAATNDLTDAAKVTAEHPGFDVVGQILDAGFTIDNFTKPLRLDASNAVAVDGQGREVALNTCNGECLTDVTNADLADLDAAGFRGFFFRLEVDERMLRDPLTVLGTTFFKTYKPTRAATACDPAIGRDTIYAMNVCSAEPLLGSGATADSGNDYQNARKAQDNESGSIGGNIQVFTPAKGELMVADTSMGSTDADGNLRDANLLQAQVGVRMLFWYKPEL